MARAGAILLFFIFIFPSFAQATTTTSRKTTTTNNLTHVATSCHPDRCPGLILSGGRDDTTDTESFPAGCAIPPFPEYQDYEDYYSSEYRAGKHYHSLSVVNNGRKLVACGGTADEGGYRGYDSNDCFSWESGQSEWKHFHTLRRRRAYHAAVVMGNDDIILVGGRDGDSDSTFEIVKQGGEVFHLHQTGPPESTPIGIGVCAIAYNHSEFVTIGGIMSDDSVHGLVYRYDSQGNYISPLATINTPRTHSACSIFTASSGEEGFLVTGGFRCRSCTESEHLTELYLPSNNRWTNGKSLPSTAVGPRAVLLNHEVVVAFGVSLTKVTRDVEVQLLRYDPVADSWSDAGKIEREISNGHTVAAADLATLCPDMDVGTLETPETKPRLTDPGQCQPIRVPICDDLRYNQTIFPNLLGHANQEEATKELEHLYPLVQTTNQHHFLCALYAPVCTILKEPLPPCRALCQAARKDFEDHKDLMSKLDLQWPENLVCHNFPEADEINTLCVGKQRTGPNPSYDISTTGKDNDSMLEIKEKQDIAKLKAQIAEKEDKLETKQSKEIAMLKAQIAEQGKKFQKMYTEFQKLKGILRNIRPSAFE